MPVANLIGGNFSDLSVDEAFICYCKGTLKHLSDHFFEEKIQTLSYGYFSSSDLVSVSLAEVGSVERWFPASINLTTVSFPLAKSIAAHAFHGLYKLSFVSLPSAEVIGQYAFYGCSKLQTISLPSAKKIDQAAFYLCTSLQIATLPSIETIGADAFYETSLKEISIGEKIKTIAVNAFRNSKNIVINIQKAKDSVPGAPWGAVDATINWLGEEGIR